MYKIASLCLVLFIGLYPKLTFAQIDYEKLLTENSEISIDSNQNGVSFDMFDSSFKDKRVFFTGEDHRYIESNNNYSLAFMKYLHQKHGVRHMIIELGQTWGKLLNTYVQTGDSVIFELIKKSSYVSYQQYFKKLYEFNKDLPDEEKIIITGIDVTRSFSISVHYLNHLIPQRKLAPDEILVNVEAIRSLSIFLVESDKKDREQGRSLFSAPPYSFYNSLDSILSNYNDYRSLYENYLDTNFTEFAAVMKGLEEHLVWRKYESKNMIQKFIFREQFMLKQFEKLLSQYPEDKFYGQFGRCHIGQNTSENDCEWYGIRPIATRMNEMNNEAIQGKVMTLAIIYTDGMSYKMKLSESINEMINNTPKNSIHVFPYSEDILNPDSTADFALPARYNYVIIDSKSKLPLSYTDSGPSYDRLYNFYDDAYSIFGVSLSSKLSSLNNLNQSLSVNAAFSHFSRPIEIVTYFYERSSIGGRWGTGYGFDFGKVVSQSKSLDTHSIINLRGFQAHGRVHLIYRLGKNRNTWLQSSLQLGYAQQQVRFDYINPNTTTIGGFENFETTTFRSPYFSVIPSVNLSRMFWNFILVGVEGGYSWHASKSVWRESGKTIVGPNQKWGGLYYGIKASLAIYSY